MWHTRKNQVGLFFGDTSGEGFVINKNGGNGSNWRSNVVAFFIRYGFDRWIEN